MPFIDHVLSDLKEHIADHIHAVYCLLTIIPIIPAFVNQYAFDDLLPGVEMDPMFIDDSHDKF